MKIVSFYSSVGGTGKSTLTMNVAAVLQERYGKNVAIVDTADNCFSLSELRKNDLKKHEHLDIDENLLVKIIRETNFDNFLKICQSAQYDILFVDVNTDNLFFLMKCNAIFFVSNENFELYLETFEMFKNMIGSHSDFNLQQAQLVFNKIAKNQIDDKNKYFEILKKKEFILPVIPNDKARYGKINTLQTNFNAEMVNLSKNILETI